MDKILNNWNNYLNEQTEPFQQKVKKGYVKDRDKYLKGGKGKPSKPFNVPPSNTRSKSAPPIGENQLEEIKLQDITDKAKELKKKAGEAGSRLKASMPSIDAETGFKAAALATGLTAGGAIGANALAISNRMDAEREARQHQNMEEAKETIQFQNLRNEFAPIMNILSSGTPKTKEESIKLGNQVRQSLSKKLNLSDVKTQDILDSTLFGGMGGSFDVFSGTANLQSYIDLFCLLKMQNPQLSGEEIYEKTIKLWYKPEEIKKLKDDLNVNTAISFGPLRLDTKSMGGVQWGSSKNESKKRFILKNGILEIKFRNLSKGKDVWTDIDPELLKMNKKEPGEDTNLNDELFDILDKSYRNIGGHVHFKKPSDLPHNHTGWKAVDVDADDNPDALRVWKTDKFGDIKLTAGGSDGSDAGKQAYLNDTAEMLNTEGVYAELSDAVGHIMMTRYHIPCIDNQASVEKVLGEEVEWVGQRPDGKYPTYKGWYVRNIAGEPHMKIMLGHPSSVQNSENPIEEVYQIDEGIFKDLYGMMRHGADADKQESKDYTDFNEVYKNIYVGSAPIKGGKPIASLLKDPRFERILVMSKEVADIISNFYKGRVPDKFKLDYAIEDIANPSEEDIKKLKAAALYARLIAKERGILITCNKGKNRSVATACLAMTSLGMKPQEAIDKVRSVRGDDALMLAGKPHPGFLPIINQKK